MEYDRNIQGLIQRKIIWRRDHISDTPTETFEWGWFFKEGTFECYTLFGSKAKIRTYRGLKWHLYVLWYLNPQLDQEEFNELTKFICNQKNGFITFNVGINLCDSISYDVSMNDLEKPPPNKLRKVIFKDFCGLTTSEKLSIVGTLVHAKGITNTEIYEAMLALNDEGKSITIAAIAKTLKCSTRTIYRNMDNELKKEKLLLNQSL